MSEKRSLKFDRYKTLIFAISILIIIIILDIIFENYSKNAIEKINSNIDKIGKAFEIEGENYDKEELEKLSEKARNEWRKREDILSCFIEHDEVEKINIKLDVLYTQVKNEVWMDAKSTVSEVKRLVKYLEGKYELSIQNIF